MNFNPFPVLISENLVLKQAKNSDWEEVLFLRSNKEVNEFVKRPLSNNKENALAFIEKVNIGILNNENLYWKITQKKQDKMIGSISLWNFSKDKLTGEVGYDLHPDFHNKGVMSEALKVVMNFGFTILKW